jgi:hypothetical protein
MLITIWKTVKLIILTNISHLNFDPQQADLLIENVVPTTRRNQMVDFTLPSIYDWSAGMQVWYAK